MFVVQTTCLQAMVLLSLSIFIYAARVVSPEGCWTRQSHFQAELRRVAGVVRSEVIYPSTRATSSPLVRYNKTSED